MMNGPSPISIATQSKDYSELRHAVGKDIVDSPPPLPSFGPLHIKRPSNKPIVHSPSKGVL